MNDQPDNDFLDSVGLGLLPDEDRLTFLRHVRAELQERVGKALVDGMSPQLLDEFEQLSVPDESVARAFLRKHDTYWLVTNKDKPSEQMAAHACQVWLSIHRPDYAQVVTTEQERIKDEIRARAPEIVAASGVDPQA